MRLINSRISLSRCLLTAGLLLLFSCSPGSLDSAHAQLLLPGDMGNYAVGHSRITPDDDPTQSGTLYVWYPADQEDTVGAEQTKYQLSGLDFPSDYAFDGVTAADGDSFPLIVYFHGAGGWGAMQPTLAETLASYGFVVAAMTQNFDVNSMLDRFANVSADPSTLLFGKIDSNNAGIIGFSFGASQAIAFNGDDRIRAVMPIAVGQTNSRNTVPLLVLTGSRDGAATTSRTAFDVREGGDRYFTSINDAGHLSFADWCNRIEYANENYGTDTLLGFRQFEDQACTDAHIPNEQAVDLTNFYAAAFFGRYLQDETSYQELLTAEYALGNAFPVEFQSIRAFNFNGDDRVDLLDLDALSNEIATATNGSIFDLNRDGVVNEQDLMSWLSDAATHNGFGQAFLAGDSDLDGNVDARDLNSLALNWRQEVTRWSGGDFTADGVVDASDLNKLALNWRESILVAGAASNVPEPTGGATLIWTLVAFVGVASRFHSRTRAKFDDVVN